MRGEAGGEEEGERDLREGEAREGLEKNEAVGGTDEGVNADVDMMEAGEWGERRVGGAAKSGQ